MGQILPPSDKVYSDYQHFRSIFGEEANVIILAISDPDFFRQENLEKWMILEKKIKEIDSVDWTMSVTSTAVMYRNDSLKKLEFRNITSGIPSSQAQCDSISALVKNLPFYEGILFQQKSNSYIMFAGLSKNIIHSKERIQVVKELREVIASFEQETGKHLYISGLPFIRTDTIVRSQREIIIFVILAAIITALVLFLFFRSFWGIVVPLLVVGIGIIWSNATLVMLGYKITTLTGLIPPLIIVIGIPNAVFMITRYHQEYLKYGNQVRALMRVVEKTGKAIFLTNLTTSIGFGTLLITNSKMLEEFGLVIFINIMCLFVLSLLLIPIFFSFMPPPGKRHLRHLTNKRTNFFVNTLVKTVEKFRPVIFVVSAIVAVVSLIGISRLKASGRVADDVPKNSRTFKDLKFFEEKFTGVMPFEIMVDTRKNNGIFNPSLWKKIDILQDSIDSYPQFSKAVSAVNLIKYANQAFYGGTPDEYRLPSQLDLPAISKYVDSSFATTQQGNSALSSYMDKDRRYIRIHSQMADIGTYDMKKVTRKVEADIREIFGEESQVDIILSGASLVIMKGTDYLLRNLFGSLLVAVLLIAGIMALLFRTPKMVLISLIPNLIPLVFTAGLMGWLDIPVKASTCLIFSVAFGISVDDTIHYLAKYRQELKHYDGDIRQAVFKSLAEAGISMGYTSIILFFGFSIFMASEFGGTVALGMLVSITLFVAMFTNLLLLPSLLLAFYKKTIDNSYNKQPIIEFYDDEDENEEEVKPKS